MNRGFYHFCPQCGSIIDPGEKCGCTAARIRRSREALEDNHGDIDRDHGTKDGIGVDGESHIFSLSAMS